MLPDSTTMDNKDTDDSTQESLTSSPGRPKSKGESGAASRPRSPSPRSPPRSQTWTTSPGGINPAAQEPISSWSNSLDKQLGHGPNDRVFPVRYATHLRSSRLPSVHADKTYS
jgi:hypothetical protein